MKFLNMIDGQKTYILTIIAGIFALVHFFVVGDYHTSSFLQLGQDQAFLAMVAALRHGVAKIGNNGNIGKPSAVIVAFMLLTGLLCQAAFAQTASTNTPAASITGTLSNALQAVNVPIQVTKIKDTGLAVNTGFFYSIGENEIYSTYSYSPFGGMAIGTWGTWDYINLGYGDPNLLIAGSGIVVNAGSITSKLKMTFSSTIQNILNNTSFGLAPTVGIKNVGGTNSVKYGIDVYGKITF